MEDIVKTHCLRLPYQDSLSAEEKLIWLSKLRVTLELELVYAASLGGDMDNAGAVPATTWLIENLRGFLHLGEDAFVFYAAQQVLVALMKWSNPQEGLACIQAGVEAVGCVPTVVAFLEVCHRLLSKQNSHCSTFLQDIQTCLGQAMHTLAHAAYKHTAIVYQLVRIVVQIIRLARKFKNKCTYSVLNNICFNNCTVFLDILFQSDVESFVKRKLCLTLYFIVQPGSDILKNSQHMNNVGIVDCVDSKLVRMSECFMRTVLDIGFTSLICKTESLDGFTGAYNLKRYTIGFNYVYLREWSILSIGMALPLLTACDKGTDVLCSSFLLALDECVKQVIGKVSPAPFTWLPKMFADQDDMWVDALLMLMDIQPSVASVEPHWYFLQFVSCLAFDDLVLLDLLSSPETHFLDYLTRYLKYLLQTGAQFASTVSKFQHYSQYVDPHADCIQDGRKDYVKHVVHDKLDILCESEQHGSHDFGDEGANIKAEHYYSVRIGDYNSTHCGIDLQESEIKTCSLFTESTEDTCFSDVANDKDKSIVSFDGVHDNQKSAVLQNSFGLSMLMETYSDSDEERDHDYLEKAVGNSEVVNFESESNDVTGIPVTPGESFSTSTHVEKRSCCPHHKCVESQFCIEADCVTRTGGGGYEATAGRGVQAKDPLILDQTLAMLIRVALKLQRLWRHQILSYDPSALVRLLEDVEICIQTTN